MDGPDSGIENDLGRTMPLNILYRGDCAEVGKLRREC